VVFDDAILAEGAALDVFEAWAQGLPMASLVLRTWPQIPDEAYRGNFVGLARQLQPPGSLLLLPHVRTMGL